MAVLHRHTEVDEAFYVVAGKLEAQLDDKRVQAAAGGFLWVPRGTAHSFANAGPEPVQVLALALPGGVEELFAEQAAYLSSVQFGVPGHDAGVEQGGVEGEEQLGVLAQGVAALAGDFLGDEVPVPGWGDAVRPVRPVPGLGLGLVVESGRVVEGLVDLYLGTGSWQASTELGSLVGRVLGA